MHRAAGHGGHVVVDGTDQHYRMQMGQAVEDRPDRRRERRGHYQSGGARVGEHIGVLLRIEIGVERHRHVAGADRAPERHRIIDRIVQQERHAVLAREPERAQAMRESDGALMQIAVSERTIGIDEGDLGRTPGRDMSVDEIGDGVVGPALGQILQHAAPLRALNSRTSA